uniref:Uncharacterized protein n=1 Tax=viral metagenome TaxID=1070528 RepID=A0A6M3LJ26_9ZZZZ
MNDFHEDLEFSHKADELSCWEEIYNTAFPANKAITNTRDNGDLQHLGIDRTIVLSSGKAIYIDEKVRRKDYGDILLEYISNSCTETKGWVEKPLFCDYIAYAILPINTCYLLPVPQLQKAWIEHKDLWLFSYGTRIAENKYYNTLSCPVPINILFKAIGNSLRIRFTGSWNR